MNFTDGHLNTTDSAYRCAMRAKSLALVIACANSQCATATTRGWRYAALLRLMRQGYSHAEASAVVDAGGVL